jgi:hypothetical protein
MTSIRMEPVWVILGQSAGVAAAQSLKENVTVQSVNITSLQKILLTQGQKIAWTGN